MPFTNIVDRITDFWSGVLDTVAVLEGLGVVIFHFSDLSGSHDQANQNKLELASKIENLSFKEENRIHLVTVALENKSGDLKSMR